LTATSAEFREGDGLYQFRDEGHSSGPRALVGRWGPVAGPGAPDGRRRHDSMRNFARSYGDDNPLFRLRGLRKRGTRWGAQIAPPMIPIALKPAASTADPPGGAAEAPRRSAASTCSCRASTLELVPAAGWPVTSCTASAATESVVEKKSEFAERSPPDQRGPEREDEPAGGDRRRLARTLAIHYRAEEPRRGEGPSYGGPSSPGPANTEEDIERLDAVYAAEQVAGRQRPAVGGTVSVGDALTPMAKGPLTVDRYDRLFTRAATGSCPMSPVPTASAYANPAADRAVLRFRNEFGVPDVAPAGCTGTSAWGPGHRQTPMAYDYTGVHAPELAGCPHFVTDWTGGRGAGLVSQGSQMRKFNYIGGQPQSSPAEVVGKRIENGRLPGSTSKMARHEPAGQRSPAPASAHRGAGPAAPAGPVPLPRAAPPTLQANSGRADAAAHSRASRKRRQGPGPGREVSRHPGRFRSGPSSTASWDESLDRAGSGGAGSAAAG